MRWVSAALVTAVVFSAGCGSRVDGPAAARPSSTTTTRSAAAPGDQTAAPEVAGGTTAPAGSPGVGSTNSKTSTGGGTPGAGSTTSVPPGSLPVSLTLSRTCATRGSTVTATVRTRPSAEIAAAVIYADGDDHDTFSIGSADGSGTWRWPFVVSTEAPNGRAEVQVAAADRTPTGDGHGASTTGEQGTAKAEFEVKKSCS